jgi:hypothetical protein
LPLTKVMLTKWLGTIFNPRTALLLVIAGCCSPALAQEVSYALVQPASMEPIPMTPIPMTTSFATVNIPKASKHRFWDRENTFLFATSAAFSAADFVITRNNLRNGGQELNPVTRLFAGSTTGLAVNFTGESVGVVGLSYFLHKTGHHKLERAVSMLNIGSSAAAVTFDLARR